MKNIFFILLTCFSIFSLNSCREDGEWGNENGGQFGFTIERDDNFIEKAIGETNQLKFNIVTNYDFNSIETKFKFVTNLNGILKLNGQTLTANQEYTLTSKDNIFEYVGLVAGTHDLKINVKNDKGASKEEVFELKYSVSEFTLTTSGGTADIYQGDETVYNHKITLGSGQPNTNYQIKFDTYNGEIKFNGVPAVLGQFYPINNINDFNVSLKTNQIGQGKLTYTIKNPTVSKPYEIQQTIIARQIVIESMNASSLSVVPNTPMSLVGIVKKTPITTNSTVHYKTWISSASNNNLSGIQTTNNIYTPYALGANGSFSINFNALETGSYTLNIQTKDEFGNESNIKSFDIVVGTALAFVGSVNANLIIKKTNQSNSITNKSFFSLKNLVRNFSVSASPSTIIKVKYLLSFTADGVFKEYSFEEDINFLNNLNYSNSVFDLSLLPNSLFAATNCWISQQGATCVPPTVSITNAKLKIKVTANDNATIEQEIDLPFTISL